MKELAHKGGFIVAELHVAQAYELRLMTVVLQHYAVMTPMSACQMGEGAEGAEVYPIECSRYWFLHVAPQG
jgi:hypothetical protein